MLTPIVSVIIPAYNAERWLNETIQSVLEQTYQDFELIIVDDGSTDDTAKVVRLFHDSRIRYVYQANKGLAGARNTGIKICKGRYIGFLDADDLWHPEMLETCVSFLDEHSQVDVVRTGYYLIDSEGRRLPTKPNWAPWCENVLDRLVANKAFFLIHTALIRKQCFNAVGLFDESLRAGEDWDLWIRIAAAGFQFGFIHQTLAMYRRHENNMTLDYKRMRTSALAVLDKLFNQPNIAGRVSYLESKAYANILVRTCIAAFRNNLVKLALRDYTLAIEYDISVITNLDLYYQIACIGLPAGHTPTFQNIDLDMGQQHLNNLMKHIDSIDSVRITLFHKRRAKATIHLALGMIWYSYKSDMQSARKHFVNSIRHLPHSQLAWTWLARAVVGKDRVQSLRPILGRHRWYGAPIEPKEA